MKKIITILALLTVSMNFVRATDDTECSQYFGEKLQEMPCDCFYKSSQGFSTTKMNIANNLMDRIKGSSLKSQKIFFKRVDNILMNGIKRINTKEIEVEEDKKLEFFAVANYLTCRIANERTKKPELNSTEAHIASAILEKDNLKIPDNYKKIADDYLKYDPTRYDIYKKEDNQAVYAHDFIIYDKITGDSLYLYNMLFFNKLERGVNGIYLLNVGANGYSKISIIKLDGIEIKDIISGWPDNENNTLAITGFELLTGKRMKIFYEAGSGKEEKIIDISNILSD